MPTVCATAKEAILAMKQGRVAAALLDATLLYADVCEELQRRAIADALIGKVAEALHGTRKRA